MAKKNTKKASKKNVTKLKKYSPDWWRKKHDEIYGIVTPEMIAELFGPKETKIFYKFMSGQTSTVHGFYVHDVKKFCLWRTHGSRTIPMYD